MRSDGAVLQGAQTFGDDTGFVDVQGDKTLAKVPHAGVVFCSSGRIRRAAYLYDAVRRRWQAHRLAAARGPAGLAAVLMLLLQAVRRWWVRNLNRYYRLGAWLHHPTGPYALSDSLEFLADGCIRFVGPDGTTGQERIGDVGSTEVSLHGVAGRWELIAIDEHRIDLRRIGERHGERFEYDADNGAFYRFATGYRIAEGETDEFGVTYLPGGKVSFAASPAPFTLSVRRSRPWTVELPGGCRAVHRCDGYLLVLDANLNFHERYSGADGQWLRIATGGSEVVAPWILDGSKGTLSVTVLGVLELFLDGQVCFLNTHMFVAGEAIDVTGPAGLRLVRQPGSGWIYLFEHGDCVGAGYYDPDAFPDQEGMWHPGWGWGQEVLPGTDDDRLRFVLPWAVIAGVVVDCLTPIPVAYVLLMAVFAYIGLSLGLWLARRVWFFLGPVAQSLLDPIVRGAQVLRKHLH
ncbi:MAG: hypothetical protein CMJ58_25620 [Planctomycetaceae bacterium]|nr:hypothetical protein [Planctomycetaceae bacterium]